MFDFLAAHAGVLSAIVVLLAGVVLLTVRWEAISLSLQSTWHSLPLIGGIAWLARRQRSRQMADRMHSDMSAALALCGSYARFIRVLNRTDYDNYMNYLRKAGDLGRRPFPPYLWVVISSMILVEAAGLAYVLAGWTLPGASEFAQQIAAGGIGFLIAVVLVFFTHWAGVEIYQSNQYRRARSEWVQAGRTGALYGPDLSLNDPQAVDDQEPAFRQRATRGHGKTTYFLTTITVIMVLAVGSGAAFVRGQVLEQELVYEAATRAKAIQRFDLEAPAAADKGERSAADKQAVQEELSIKRRGGWGTLVILAIIFFFLQVLGIFFGYRYSFNGRLSKDAYRALKADRFSSYNELLQYYDRIADIAQSKLERLQQRIAQRQSDNMGTLRLTQYSFRDYLQERDAQRREKPLGGERDAPLADPAAAAAAPSTADAVHAAPEPADAPPPAAVSTANGGAPAPSVPESTFAPLVSPEPALTSPRSADPYFPLRSPAPSGAGEQSARAQLELAESIERQRAAERARSRAAKSKGKGSAQTESEAG